MDQQATIGGPVVKFVKHPDGDNILIGAGHSAETRFEIYIPAAARPDFGQAVDDIEPGMWVCVTGRVDRWKGTPEIDVRDPDDLVVDPAGS